MSSRTPPFRKTAAYYTSLSKTTAMSTDTKHTQGSLYIAEEHSTFEGEHCYSENVTFHLYTTRYNGAFGSFSGFDRIVASIESNDDTVEQARADAERIQRLWNNDADGVVAELVEALRDARQVLEWYLGDSYSDQQRVTTQLRYRIQKLLAKVRPETQSAEAPHA